MSDTHHIEALIAGQGRESKAHWEGLRREIGVRFDAVDARLAAIDEKQRIANGRVTTMEQALTRVDERVGQLQKADGEQAAKIADIDRRVHLHRRDDDSRPTPHTRREDDHPLTLNVALRYWRWITAAFMAGVGAVLLVLQLAGKL